MLIQVSNPVLREIQDERERQDIKWGLQNHNRGRWADILIEEIGEMSKAVNEGDWDNYRVEMVQSAAVLVAMIESFDRGYGREDA